MWNSGTLPVRSSSEAAYLISQTACHSAKYSDEHRDKYLHEIACQRSANRRAARQLFAVIKVDGMHGNARSKSPNDASQCCGKLWKSRHFAYGIWESC